VLELERDEVVELRVVYTLSGEELRVLAAHHERALLGDHAAEAGHERGGILDLVEVGHDGEVERAVADLEVAVERAHRHARAGGAVAAGDALARVVDVDGAGAELEEAFADAERRVAHDDHAAIAREGLGEDTEGLRVEGCSTVGARHRGARLLPGFSRRCATENDGAGRQVSGSAPGSGGGDSDGSAAGGGATSAGASPSAAPMFRNAAHGLRKPRT